MLYSLMGIVSLLVTVILNLDLFLRPKNYSTFPGLRSYRLFLIAICVYFITDLLWGFLSDLGITFWIAFDTSIYFVTMGASVFALTLFITRYLPENKTFGRSISILGGIVFLSSLTLIIVNLFQPIFFRFDEEITLGKLNIVGLLNALKAKHLTENGSFTPGEPLFATAKEVLNYRIGF